MLSRPARPETSESASPEPRHRFRRVRALPAIAWVLVLGLVLRITVMVVYTPTIFTYYGGDSTRYLRLDVSGVTTFFGDTAMPAGYPGLLAGLHAITSWLPLTVMVQHLLGLAAAGLLYLALVRIGAPRWAALIPAIVVAFSGDQLFLEHGIFTEALWIPLLVSSMYFGCLAIADERHRRRWLVLTGVLLALSAITRSVSEFLPIVVAAWAAIAFGGPARQRIVHGVAVLVPAIIVIGGYIVIAKPIANGYSGMTENSGFSSYSRVGQFADCSEFDPPSGTRVLCVATPPEERSGPFYWTFNPESPINAKLGFSPFNADQQALLGDFARAAILNQPLDYLRTVAKDLARYLVPTIGTDRPDSGTGEAQMSFENEVPAAQGASPGELAEQIDVKYSGVGDGTPSDTARYALGAYQALFRVEGLVTLLLLGLTIAGAVAGRGPLRAAGWLFLLAGLYLFVVPVAVTSYDIRYSVPAITMLAAGAGIGAAAIQLRAARSRTPVPGASKTNTSGSA